MTSSASNVVPISVGICRRCGRRKKSSTIKSSTVRSDTFSSKCLSNSVSYDDVDVTLNRKRDSTASGDTGREVDRRRVVGVRKQLATDDDSDESHLPARTSAKWLWCERCNSRLVALKWRAVRVWLPLARERLRRRLAVEQLQEISRLLGVCINDVLQLPLVTSGHAIDDTAACKLCRTPVETLRLEAMRMIRSLEETLERSIHLGDIFAHPLKERTFPSDEQIDRQTSSSTSVTFSDNFDSTAVRSPFADAPDPQRTVGTRCCTNVMKHREPLSTTSGVRAQVSSAGSASANESDYRKLNENRTVGQGGKQNVDAGTGEQFDILCQEVIDASQAAIAFLNLNGRDSARAAFDVPDADRKSMKMKKSVTEVAIITDNRSVGVT